MLHQSNEYFELLGIGSVGNKFLPNPLVVSALQNLASNPQEVENLYDMVRSDMISKAIEGSIKKNSLKKIRLHRMEYE